MANDFWSKLGAGFQSKDGANALIGLGTGLLTQPTFAKGLAAGGQGFMQGAQLDQQYAETAQKKAETAKVKNQTSAMLRQQGATSLADAIDSGAMDSQTAFKTWYDQAHQAAGAPTDLSSTAQGRQTLAQQYGLSGDEANAYILTGKLPGANDSSKYGNSPIYARDAQGNYIAVQPGSDGSTNVMQFPDGFRPDPGALNSDRAAGTAYGSAQGAMQFNLPAAKQNVEAELANIQSLKSDTQGIEETFGKVGGIYPQQWAPVIPGSKRADYAARLEQVQGQNFLQAYTTLKGAGAITEQEGAKAQAALARLNQNQSKEAYLQSLNDLEQILATGYQRMSAQAGSGAYQSGNGAPAVGGGAGGGAGPVAGGNYVYNPQTRQLEPQ